MTENSLLDIIAARPCKHLFGLNRVRVIKSDSGETITSWLAPYHYESMKHVLVNWDGGYMFDYCPDCGAKLQDTRQAMIDLISDERLAEAIPASPTPQ